MREVADGLAQLLALIMLVITLAVSVTALSLWADSGASDGGARQEVSTVRAGAS